MADATTSSSTQGADKRTSMIRTLAMSAEKKMTQKLATSAPQMLGMDDDALDLLQSLFEFAEKVTNKEEAEKLRKDMIKVIVKLALLDKNNRFTAEDKKQLADLRLRLLATCQAVITFYETAFTFDAEFLTEHFTTSRKMVDTIVKTHLTEKTSKRVQHVFDFFENKTYMTKLYTDKAFAADLQKIASGLQRIVDANKL